MLANLSVTVCLLVVSAPPLQPGFPSNEDASQGAAAVAPQAAPMPAMGDFGPAAPYSGDYCDRCGHRHHKQTPFHDWACPPCNLSQRYPYYPKDHGHYYFRPYHMQRVLEHQALAASWGEDPRNPYGQLVFERVYDQIRAEQAAKAEVLPTPDANPDAVKPMPPMNLPPMNLPPVPPKPEPEPNKIPSRPIPMQPIPLQPGPPPAPPEEDAKKNDQSGRKPVNVLRK